MIKSTFLFVLLSLFVLSSCEDAKQGASKSISAQVTPTKAVKTKTPNANTQGAKMNEGKAGDAIKISINQLSAKKGEEACFSLRISDFNNILGFQHSLVFDPTQLKFKKAKNFGLANLNESNFGATKADQGSINFLWFDMNVKGVSMPNETVLYDLCFDVLAKAGTQCQLAISDKPTKIEVVGPNKTRLKLESNPGIVVVE